MNANPKTTFATFSFHARLVASPTNKAHSWYLFVEAKTNLEKNIYTLPHTFIIPIYVYLILDRQFYQLINCDKKSIKL